MRKIFLCLVNSGRKLQKLKTSSQAIIPISCFIGFSIVLHFFTTAMFYQQFPHGFSLTEELNETSHNNCVQVW